MSGTLTIEQELIVAWIAMGLNRKEISRLLKRSFKATEWHIAGTTNPASIRLKLGYSDPARLTHYALIHGLAELMTEPV